MALYLAKPAGIQAMNNVLFDGPYDALRVILRERGIELRTIDLGDVRDAVKVIFFDFDAHWLRRCLDAGLGPDRMALLLFEPESVRPDQYDPELWRHFGTIFTWRDDLVDNVRFFKLRFPQGQKHRTSLPAFHERGLATLINANKYSYVEGEGYTYRRRAIRFFDGSSWFDLHGRGWNDRHLLLRRETALSALRSGKAVKYAKDVIESLAPFRSYAGPVPDKYDVLGRYRFCLCYENQLNRPGFITEKLFDCFFCGTIPIYLGATNIEEHVPRECFVWMRDLPGFEALSDLMRSMTEEKYVRIRQAGWRFVHSDAFKVWTPEGVFGEIAGRI